MNNFDFYSPTKIYFGKERENEIGYIIKSFGYCRIMLHYGQNSIKKNGLYERIVKSLNENSIEYVELGGVLPNPKVSLVREGVKMAREAKIEMILAIGGGSVIDSTKAIACAYYLDVDPWCLNAHEVTPVKALPIGCILTISAAGSELSNSCVITNDKTNVKSGFNSDLIRPKFSILNPELTYTVSKYQTGCGIVDILMHTLERYLTNSGTSDLTWGFGEGLLKAVLNAGEKAIVDPTDYEARATLMLASSFSHNGLTGLGSKMYFTVHKLEHEISGTFDHVAHGAGLAVLFPAWALYVYQDFPALFSRLAYNVFGINKDFNEMDASLAGLNYLKAYFKRLGMPLTLKELGITEADFAPMAARLTKNNTSKILGIKDLDQDDILAIFKLAK